MFRWIPLFLFLYKLFAFVMASLKIIYIFFHIFFYPVMAFFSMFCFACGFHFLFHIIMIHSRVCMWKESWLLSFRSFLSFVNGGFPAMSIFPLCWIQFLFITIIISSCVSMKWKMLLSSFFSPFLHSAGVFINVFCVLILFVLCKCESVYRLARRK